MPAPNNLAQLDCSPEALERDARYGVQVVDAYSAWMSNTPRSIQGQRYLELGPGTNYAGALGMKGRGAASVSVADRWLSPWRQEYHPAVYGRVSEILSEQGREAEAAAFAQAAREGHAALVGEITGAAEDIEAPTGAFDVVFSNAVVEHFEDYECAFAELFRVTASGGWHFHQIDYRNHSDFSRPLEHLLIDRDEFLERARAAHFELGCQERAEDHQRMFEAAGFEVFSIYRDLVAERPYLDDLEARGLRVADPTLGALFTLHKP